MPILALKTFCESLGSVVPAASICDLLSLTDLFMVGLGFDIAGAVLLLRGLLLSPRAIASLHTWYGIEVGATLERAENRVDGFYGGFGLVAGFFLQAVGYAAELSGAEGATGSGRLLIALLLSAGSALSVALLYFASRETVLKRTLVAVARSREGSGDLGDEKGSDWTREKVIILVKLGEAKGWPRLDSDEDGITRVNYVRRVFGIEVPPFPCDEP
jgi:hypothetical protein